ncbi:unnamed protein product [Phaeothamnion confervicola]
MLGAAHALSVLLRPRDEQLGRERAELVRLGGTGSVADGGAGGRLPNELRVMEREEAGRHHRQAEGKLCTVESFKLFERERAGEYAIMPASATVFQALCQGKRQQVDVEVFTCTCRFPQQYKIACCHMIAVHLFRRNQPLQLSELIDSAFLVSQYIEAYGVPVFMPLLEELIQHEKIRPPLPVVRPGKQKGSKKRKASEAVGGGSSAAVSVGGGAASAGIGAAAGSGTRKGPQWQERFPSNGEFNHTARYAPMPAVRPVAMAVDTAAAAAHAYF